MSYNYDFKFYLLPSGAIFDEYIQQFQYKNDVPYYTNKDISPLIDIDVDEQTSQRLYNNDEMSKMIDIIRQQENSEELEEIFNNVIHSHMGILLLATLYSHNQLQPKDRKKMDSEVNAVIKINNYPVEKMVEKPKGFKPKTLTKSRK